MKARSNPSVDFAKLFFAYCVVGIHTGLLQDIHYDVWYYVSHLIFVLAVPFFFITSGYYYHPQGDTSLLPRQVKRLLVPYFFWSLLFNFLSRNFDVRALLKGYLLVSPGAAMWFVGSMMISMVILKFLKEKRSLQIAVCVSLIFYMVGLCFGRYSVVFNGTVFEPVTQWYGKVFGSTRNFLFMGFPMMSIGHYIGRYGIPRFLDSNRKSVAVFGTLMVVLFCEGQLLRHLGSTVFSGGFLVLPLLILALLCCLLQLDIQTRIDTVLMRKLSTGIFFTHMTVSVCVYTLSGVLLHFNILEQNFNSTLVFLLVSFIATAISFGIIKLNNKWLNKLF